MSLALQTTSLPDPSRLILDIQKTPLLVSVQYTFLAGVSTLMALGLVRLVLTKVQELPVSGSITSMVGFFLLEFVQNMFLEHVSIEIPVGFLFDVERNFVGIFPLSADILKMAPGFLLVMNSCSVGGSYTMSSKYEGISSPMLSLVLVRRAVADFPIL